MPYDNGSGLGVFNHYGVRDTGGAVGSETRDGSKVTVRVDLTGRAINDAVAGFIPKVYIPKGARFNAATLRVDEVFVVTGTSPVVEVGAKSSEATNGVTITEAQLEALGTYNVSAALSGTWATDAATGTAAAAYVNIILGGTSPAVAAASGKATLVLEYINVTKV